MSTINPAIVRNLLRYLSGALVAKGVLTSETGAALIADPALAEMLTVALGVVLGGATEAAYALAKRLGWRT